MSPATLGRTVQQAPYHGVRRVGDEGYPADAYCGKQGRCGGGPARARLPSWPRPSEAWGRPELEPDAGGSCWRANGPKPLCGRCPHRRMPSRRCSPHSLGDIEG